jgi:hypothetical protein
MSRFSMTEPAQVIRVTVSGEEPYSFVIDVNSDDNWTAYVLPKPMVVTDVKVEVYR